MTISAKKFDLSFTPSSRFGWPFLAINKKPSCR